MRFLRYTILAITLILWGGGLSSSVSRWLNQIGFIIDDYRFGDLYRISALPQFKQKHPTCPPSHRGSDTASTHLYIIGDSFSESQRLSQDDFRVSHYLRVAWEKPQRIQLDSTKRNVLLIESVERHVREHFSKSIHELEVEKDTSRMDPPSQPSLFQRFDKEFHRTDVEERLDSELFGRDWAFWIKELKASLTFTWFNRVYSGVSISKDKKSLFLHSDTDTDTSKALNSSFSTLTDREVKAMVDTINAVADQYRKLGFDEVYLSLIPNKASIMEPNRGPYNHLIERIQEHPRLSVPTVDTYGTFQKNAPFVYMKSDTHWNCEGRALWLNLTRQKLRI